MATSLKSQLASKGVKVVLKNKDSGEQMKFTYAAGKSMIPIHVTIDSFSLYGQLELVETNAVTGKPDMTLHLHFDMLAPEVPAAPKAEVPAAPKAEEPKAEEPKAEEPKAEEPKAEEPKAEEPKAEEPKAEEPKIPEEPPVEPPAVNIPVEQPTSTEAPAAPVIRPPEGKGRRNR